ncbi:MAG: hypothetical protein ACRCT6_02710 [Notoacmeibacter sp.]
MKTKRKLAPTNGEHSILSLKSKKFSSSTQKIYEEHAASLSRQAKASLKRTKLSFLELANWFATQDFCWKQSTIVGYRNALLMKAREHISGAKLAEFEQAISNGPHPHKLKLKTVSGRNTKRKNITRNEWSRFQKIALDSSNDWDHFIVSFLKFGLLVACRPIEMGSMYLAGDMLYIQTAKSNELRGLDSKIPVDIVAEILIRQVSFPEGLKFRKFDLQRLDTKDRATIKFVCDVIADWVKEKRGWSKFYDALRARCRVLSARARIAPAISPSSVRHLAISAIKSASGIKAAAAAAGHASTKATINSYKSASTKSLQMSKANLARPDTKAIDLVRVHKNTLHPRMRETQLAHDKKLVVNGKEAPQINVPVEEKPIFDSKENMRRLLEALSKPPRTTLPATDNQTAIFENEQSQTEIQTEPERPSFRKP